MSKRKSQTAVADYRAQGYIRRGVRQFPRAARLVERDRGGDLLAVDELAERFDLERVQSGGAVFDRERLEWLNGQWIRRLSDDELVERVAALPARRPGEGAADGSRGPHAHGGGPATRCCR